LIFSRYIKQLLDNTFFSTNHSQLNLPSEIDSNGNYPATLAALINTFSESTTDFTLILDDYHNIKISKSMKVSSTF